MAQSDGVPVVPMRGKKKHLKDDDLFACTFTDGKTYKVPWRDVKLLFVDPPSKWHIKDLTGGNLPVANVDAVFAMDGTELSGKAATFTVQPGQEVIIFGNDVRYNQRGQDTTCNWNFGDQTDTKNQTMWDDMFPHNLNFNGDIQHLDITEKAFNISYMFSGCQKFNQPVGHFNTVNCNNIKCAFQVHGGTTATTAFNQDIKWDTSNCQDITGLTTAQRFFDGTVEFTSVSKVKKAINSFTDNDSFTGKGNMASWKTPEAERMDGMYRNCPRANLDLRQWCVPKIGSAPPDFNKNSPGINSPVWGTCP